MSKSRWTTNRNLVPGHWRQTKDGRRLRNPGYSLRVPPDPFTSIWGTRRQILDAHAKWFKPFSSHTNRRDKRGQSKPR